MNQNVLIWIYFTIVNHLCLNASYNLNCNLHTVKINLSSIVNTKIIILKGSGLWTLSVLMLSAKLLIYVLQKELQKVTPDIGTCGTTWFLFVSLSWLVEMLILLQSHLGYIPVYKDGLIHYFGPHIFGDICILIIFIYINPVWSCWENLNLEHTSPCIYIHIFLLLSVGRFKITMQRIFWGSRTEIHELLNSWFFLLI